MIYITDYHFSPTGNDEFPITILEDKKTALITVPSDSSFSSISGLAIQNDQDEETIRLLPFTDLYDQEESSTLATPELSILDILQSDTQLSANDKVGELQFKYEIFSYPVEQLAKLSDCPLEELCAWITEILETHHYVYSEPNENFQNCTEISESEDNFDVDGFLIAESLENINTQSAESSNSKFSETDPDKLTATVLTILKNSTFDVEYIFKEIQDFDFEQFSKLYWALDEEKEKIFQQLVS